jgi:hypothetical protein
MNIHASPPVHLCFGAEPFVFLVGTVKARMPVAMLSLSLISLPADRYCILRVVKKMDGSSR